MQRGMFRFRSLAPNVSRRRKRWPVQKGRRQGTDRIQWQQNAKIALTAATEAHQQNPAFLIQKQRLETSTISDDQSRSGRNPLTVKRPSVAQFHGRSVLFSTCSAFARGSCWNEARSDKVSYRHHTKYEVMTIDIYTWILQVFVYNTRNHSESKLRATTIWKFAPPITKGIGERII